jgi:hypothetical protein
MYDGLNLAVIDLEKFVGLGEKISKASMKLDEKPTRLQSSLQQLYDRMEEAGDLTHRGNKAIKFKKVEGEKLTVDNGKDLTEVITICKDELVADIKQIRAHTPRTKGEKDSEK